MAFYLEIKEHSIENTQQTKNSNGTLNDIGAIITTTSLFDALIHFCFRITLFFGIRKKESSNPLTNVPLLYVMMKFLVTAGLSLSGLSAHLDRARLVPRDISISKE